MATTWSWQSCVCQLRSSHLTIAIVAVELIAPTDAESTLATIRVWIVLAWIELDRVADVEVKKAVAIVVHHADNRRVALAGLVAFGRRVDRRKWKLNRALPAAALEGR